MSMWEAIQERIHTALVQKQIIRSPTEDFYGDAEAQDAQERITDSLDEAAQELHDVMAQVVQTFSKCFDAVAATARICADSLAKLCAQWPMIAWRARGPVRRRNLLKAARYMQNHNKKEAQ